MGLTRSSQHDREDWYGEVVGGGGEGIDIRRRQPGCEARQAGKWW